MPVPNAPTSHALGATSPPVPAPEAGPALQQARHTIACTQAQLQQHGLSLRAPPPEPQTCCGRGCNGCVWEGYFGALSFWCEDAEALLAAQARDDQAAPATAQ